MTLRVLRFLLGGALVLSIILAAPAVYTSASGQRLGSHSLDLLQAARAAGDPTVTLLVATAPGVTKAVAARLASFGTVRFEDDDIGYVRVVVPTARAEAAAGVDGIVGVELDETVPIPDPRPDRSDAPEWAQTPPSPSTPALNPYMPTQDTGAPQFVAAHPTYDGRGVVIGIVDTGQDLFTPELQTAKSVTGASVPKFKDWVTFTDPVTDGDPTWINMKDQVRVSGGTFSYGGRTYTGAPNGSFRVGVFKEADLGSNSEYSVVCGGPANAPVYCADVNRNGVFNEIFAVLWRTTDNMVWVDANADASFADDPPITDYKVARQVRTFGTDDPATELRETVPFVVQTNGKDKFVNIGIVAGSHGTHVAGIAAGKDFFGGAFDGAAPEAQIVSVRACLFSGGCTNHAMTEGMIYAAKQSNVDVISMSIGGLPALNDGNNARAILYNRLIDYSKVQMFFSAGNSYPGMNTVGDPSVATKVMSLGAYVSQDSWLVNYGATVTKADGLFTFSSRGPAENGALKPDIVAPGSAVSCIPKWEQNYPLVGPLPAGYDMFNGTSMAAPQASGGAALLVSAAKQAGVQYKPDQLRQAMHQSARYLPGYGAYEQGDGLLNIPAAWELLKTNIKTEEIVSYAPVNTVISQYLAEPGYGPGIYQREGWSVGDERTLPITFVRLKGTAAAAHYALSWLGNDGTFQSADSIALPRGEAVALNVKVTAAAAGIHSAILQLKDPSTDDVVYQVMNTVAVVKPFTAANNFTVSYAGQADKADKASFLFAVPANTAALKIDITGINGRVRLLRYHPYGVSVDSTSTAFQTGGTISRTYANPLAGVWEAIVEVSRSSAVNPTTFTVTGSLLAVSVAPTSWTVDPATIGTDYQQVFTFTNMAGAFTGGASAGALGTMKTSRDTIAAGAAQQIVSITVPADATRLDVRIGNPSDPGADLDLYLFDCTSGKCNQVASSAGSTSTEAVAVATPAAGRWVALIDPYAVPSGSTDYDYTDQITVPGFLTLTVADPAASHAYNTTWSATATARALADPGAGRFLYGEVQVKTGSTVLGTAKVMLKNVQ